MPASPRLRPADRVVSIIRMQSLLFDASYTLEYEQLVDFLEDRRGVKIERIISILRAQEILLGSGAFLEGGRSESAAAEIPKLIAFMRSLLEVEGGRKRKIEVLPRNLGRPFAAKNWGLPLFGDYRPAIPPKRGIILIYSSPDGDGECGELEAARLGAGDSLSYKERALSLDSDNYWLGLRARSSADSPGDEPPKARDSRSETFTFSRYELSLDRKSRRRRFHGRIADPYEYVYPYLFYDIPGATTNLERFVEDILCGIFRVPLREAERLAEVFSGRLP
jgi:hypothetical protein